jgi:hypothetical protein
LRRILATRYQHEPAPVDPPKHPAHHPLGLRHRLRNDRRVRLGLQNVGAAEERRRILDPQLAHGGALKVMGTFPGLDERDPATRPKHRDGQSREASARSEIGEAFDLGNDLGQRRRVQDQAPRDRIRRSVRRQVDLSAPALEQLRQLCEPGAQLVDSIR